MNITSSINSYNTTTVTNATNKHNTINPSEGQDYGLSTLDNETDELTETKNENITNTKESSINRFSELINTKKSSKTPDVLDTTKIAEKLNTLYYKESISITSSITTKEIEAKIEKLNMKLTQEKGDTPQAKQDISRIVNNYNLEIVEQLKFTLMDKDNAETSLAKQTTIKVLSEIQTNPQNSPLETLLASDIKSNYIDKTPKNEINYKTDFYYGLGDKAISAFEKTTEGMSYNKKSWAMRNLQNLAVLSQASKYAGDGESEIKHLDYVIQNKEYLNLDFMRLMNDSISMLETPATEPSELLLFVKELRELYENS